MNSAIGSSIVEADDGDAHGSHEEAKNALTIQENATDERGGDPTNARVSVTEISKDDSDEGGDGHPEIRCGMWSVGNPCADRVAVLAGLDTLGPFVLESCDCGLPLINSECGPFDSEDEEREASKDGWKVADCGGLKPMENDVTGLDPVDDVTAGLLGDPHRSTELSADVRELCLEDDRRARSPDRDLKELLLNDVIEDKDDGSQSLSDFASSASIEQVSDGVFRSRGTKEGEAETDRQPKRKRKEMGRRSNFVKYRLNRKRRRYPHKRPKLHVKPPAVRSVTQAAV